MNGKVTFDLGGTTFIVDERYECHKQIGHGAYGVVCSGIDTVKNKKIAVKKVFYLFSTIYRSKMHLMI